MTQYGGAIPDKAVMTKDEFADSINPYLNFFNITTVPELNALETNVNAKEISTVYSADIAIAAANYQGDWVSQGYTLNQSVSYSGSTYKCKLTHATGFAPTNTTYWIPTGIPQIINGSTAKTTPVDADLIGLVDSADAFSLKKVTWANIKATILTYLGVMIGTATAKTTPVDADIFVIGDSASSNATKKITLANLKATIFGSTALTGTPTINGGRAIDEDTAAYNNDTASFIANTLASGGLCEFGENANGTYVKYVDGTLICTFTATLVYSNASTLAYTWVFPFSFTNTNYTGSLSVGTLTTTNNNFRGNTILITTATNTQAVYALSSNVYATAGDTATGSRLTAIGRWK